MKENLFSEIDGQEIIVCDLSIRYHEKTLAVKMSCIAEDHNTYFIVFENVSKRKYRTYHIPSKFADLKYWITAHAVIKRIHVSL